LFIQKKPYFKRGDGISINTANRQEREDDHLSSQTDWNSQTLATNPTIMTNVELDEVRMENGKDYKNFPQSQFPENPKCPTFRGKFLRILFLVLQKNK